MSLSQAELEQRLREAGNDLLGLSSSSTTDEHLSRLEKAENLLGQVEQSPPQPVQDALLPSMTALISDQLFRHSVMDVKVSVVACITELMRISAPEAPYSDEQMREVFELTIVAFDHLSPAEGHCYNKAKSVLEVVSRIRSCVILLDLDCNALIVEMFEHFLRHIQSNHSEALFLLMETIMTLVLEEIDGVPFDLLSLLLACVRKENQQISPISLKLGEKVLTKCAATLEPYVIEAVKKMDIDLADYSEIVVLIYQKASKNPKDKSADDDSVEKSETKELLQNVSGPSKIGGAADGANMSISNGAASTGLARDVAGPSKVGGAVDGESKSTSNGAASTGLAQDAAGPSKIGGAADGASKSTCNGAASAGDNDKGVSKSLPAKVPRGLLIIHTKRADLRRIPEPKRSVSLEEYKSKSTVESIDRKRGLRPILLDDTEAIISKSETKLIPQKRSLEHNSLKNQEEGHLRGSQSLPTKLGDSETKPDSVPKRIAVKPKSLKNPEEGSPKGADLRGIAEPKISLSVKTENSDSDLPEEGHLRGSQSLPTEIGDSETKLDSVPKRRAVKPKSLKNPEEGSPKGADLRGIAEPKISPSVKTEKSDSDQEMIPKKRVTKRNSLKSTDKGLSRRANSRGIAEPNVSLSIKEDKYESRPEFVPKMKGPKSNSVMSPEKEHPGKVYPRGISAPKRALSTEADKLKTEPNSGPQKRGRKPNSLMNPDEGYDHSWINMGRRNSGPALQRKSRKKSNDSSLSGNPTSRKATSPLTPENVTELAGGFKTKLDDTIRVSPSENPNPANATSGPPKRIGSVLSQEVDAKSPSVLNEKRPSAQVEGKTPKPLIISLKKEPEDTDLAEEKKQGRSTRQRIAAKINEETAAASGQSISLREADVKSTAKLEATNVENSSGPRSSRRKRSNSDIKNMSSETRIKSSNGDASHKVKGSGSIFKRRRVIGKEESSELPELGEALVGRSIMVWWPTDKMFYEGVVHSYDPVKKKHKISYTDGDEEILNLRRQKWQLTGTNPLPAEGQTTNLPGLDASSPITAQEGKSKTKVDKEKQVKEEKADSSPESPQKELKKTISFRGKQAKMVNQLKEAKVDQSLGSNQRARSVQGKKVNKSDEGKQAKADLLSESNPEKGIEETQSDEAKLARIDAAQSRVKIPAAKTKVKAKSSNTAVKEEAVEDAAMTDGGPKVDRKTFAGNSEDTPKTVSKAKQIAPESIAALAKVKSTEADSEIGAEECAGKLIELSKGVKKKWRFYCSTALEKNDGGGDTTTKK